MTRPVIDLTEPGCDALDPAEDLSRRIDDLSERIDRMWREALGTGDFVEIERFTAASQALHRASVALRAGDLIGA